MFGQQPLLSHMRPDRLDSVHRSQARKYRSKRQRPCDLCRQRKTQCKLPGSGGACELCQKLGRNCTFVLQSWRKQQCRPPETPSSSAHHRGSQPNLDAYNGDPVASNAAAFEHADPRTVIDVGLQTMPSDSDPLSFLGEQSDSQTSAVDWSYLNFPICKKNECFSIFMNG